MSAFHSAHMDAVGLMAVSSGALFSGSIDMVSIVCFNCIFSASSLFFLFTALIADIWLLPPPPPLDIVWVGKVVVTSGV